jgi:uncharacterized protein (TIGR02145 family)
MAKINSKLIASTVMLVAILVISACTRDNGVDGDLSSSGVVDLSCNSNGGEIEYGYFEYEGKIYKTVTIGTQTWMSENLNYKIGYSMCYAQANCDKYGRLYDWVTAMTLDESCDAISCTDQISAKHKGICPSGWHIPTQTEWNTLSSYVESDKECSSCAAKHLKATCGWSSGGNGLDTYGFAALPGGCSYGSSGSNMDYYGYWLSATEYGDSSAYLNFMFYGSDVVHKDYYYKRNRLFGISVRCVKD